jgi:hypothetical protein
VIHFIAVLPAHDAIYRHRGTGASVIVVQAGPIGTTYVDPWGELCWVATRDFQNEFVHADIYDCERN